MAQLRYDRKNDTLFVLDFDAPIRGTQFTAKLGDGTWHLAFLYPERTFKLPAPEATNKDIQELQKERDEAFKDLKYSSKYFKQNAI